MKFDYDLFVIGAGSGGVRAARMSAAFGARVAIAEDRYLGGTCVNVGCIPKKLFVYASHYLEDFHDAAGYGWEVQPPAFRWAVLRANKDREIARLNGVYARLLGNAGAELINGCATIEDAHTIAIGDRRCTAERILVATGGWPAVPDIPGREHVITSNEVFFIDELPRRALIVGGGYIAVEFAGIFNGLGVDTTLVYRGELFLRGFDAEARRFLAEEMRRKGIDLVFGDNVAHVEPRDGALDVRFTGGATARTDLVLYATGRRPNTAGIGLESAGVELDDAGAVIVNENYATSVPHIYAIGDVTNRVNLTPVATAEGTALARSLFGDLPSQVDYRGIPSCVFSQPNLGTVGMTEEQAREWDEDIDIYRSSFTPLKHTLTGNGERTLMKMIVERGSERVIGVHMVGPDAGEIIQGIAIAMKAGATKAHFDATIGIHPTAAEEFVTMREPS